VLHALRQWHFKPAFAAILSAEHLAIAGRDLDPSCRSASVPAVLSFAEDR
jgi:hypothetical protein